MNTKKALIATMILLILMNAALASYLIFLSTGSKENAGNILYTETILKQRNIEINCKIPDEVPNPSSVIFGEMIYNEEVFNELTNKTGGSYSLDDRGRLIFVKTPDEVNVNDEFNRTTVEMISREFIENIGLQKDEFVLVNSVIKTSTDEYSVKYVYKDSLNVYYYNSYIEMSITDKGVVEAMIYVRDIKETISKKGKSLPIYSVLLTNLVSESETKVINSISFGYHFKNEYSNEAVMSFRISFEDGSERFFEVASGDEITFETEILGAKNIKFKCRIPEPFNVYNEIVYKESMLSPFDVGSMDSFSEGQVNIDDYNVITYVRTAYNNITKYELTEEVINEIGADFIKGLNLNPAAFYQDSKLQNEDGLYILSYIYKDFGNEMHFDNSINIQLNDLGVIFATIRLNNYTSGRSFEEDKNLGDVLLNNLDLSNGRGYTVTAVDSGYKRVSVESAETVACWRVTFEDGSIRFFSVLTGKELFLDNK